MKFQIEGNPYRDIELNDNQVERAPLNHHDIIFEVSESDMGMLDIAIEFIESGKLPDDLDSATRDHLRSLAGHLSMRQLEDRLPLIYFVGVEEGRCRFAHFDTVLECTNPKALIVLATTNVPLSQSNPSMIIDINELEYISVALQCNRSNSCIAAMSINGEYFNVHTADTTLRALVTEGLTSHKITLTRTMGMYDGALQSTIDIFINETRVGALVVDADPHIMVVTSIDEFEGDVRCSISDGNGHIYP